MVTKFVNSRNSWSPAVPVLPIGTVLQVDLQPPDRGQQVLEQILVDNCKYWNKYCGIDLGLGSIFELHA